jgi:RimJ/RimL family protein N-acetyltransferase
MLSLSPEAVTPALAALFDPNHPTVGRAYTVLAGVSQGQILADDAARPRWSAVREATYGTLYLGGEVDGPLVAGLLEQLRQGGDVGIGCWPDDPLASMALPEPQYDGRTLFFPARSPDVALAPLVQALPAGFTLVPRDAQLFAQSPYYADTLATFGSVEEVIRLTHAMVILHGERLVAEASTGAPAYGQIEVGVVTDEQYRQRGLATIACAALISACEAEGLATWWDCAAENLASARLAGRLGYGSGREYRYRWWQRLA